tara:strand:- start:277 stop:828 length:552 start_codon:yes stop_codon:yes gene_type:complete
VDNVVAKVTFDKRVSELSEKNKELSLSLQKADGLAKQAAPLAAKANGFEFDPDSLETLQTRYEKAQKAGYETDFAAWLGDTEGAGRDAVASRFRAQAAPAQTQTPPKVEAKTEAKTETPPVQANRLPTTPTTTTTPPVVRMSAEQVSATNARLLAEAKTATPERRAAIKAEVAQNWAKTDSAG